MKVQVTTRLDVADATEIQDCCYALGKPIGVWIREVILHALPELSTKARGYGHSPKAKDPNRV